MVPFAALVIVTADPVHLLVLHTENELSLALLADLFIFLVAVDEHILVLADPLHVNLVKVSVLHLEGLWLRELIMLPRGVIAHHLTLLELPVLPLRRSVPHLPNSSSLIAKAIHHLGLLLTDRRSLSTGSTTALDLLNRRLVPPIIVSLDHLLST